MDCGFTQEQAWCFELPNQPMPRIPDNLTYGICFSYRTPMEAAANARVGGTAFLIGKPIDGLIMPDTGSPVYLIYAITNYHVAWGGTPVLRLNREDNVLHIMPLSQSDWVPHPDGDDLAAAFVSDRLWLQGEPPNKVMDAIRFVTTEHLVTPQMIATDHIGIGDDVFMIGRFLNLQGTQQKLMPALRLGNISMMPQPLPNKVINKSQESFAVEMRSRTGFSGSPVAVYRFNESVPVDPKIHPGRTSQSWWRLLGVNWGYVNDPDTGENTWLNGVVPAWKILKLPEEPALRDKHDRSGDVMKRQRPGATFFANPAATHAVALPEPPASESDLPATALHPKGRERFNSLLDAAGRKRESED